MNYRIQKGQQGEELVATYLRNQGYTILKQNFRKRYGEVDIIAQKNDVIAFVEVKWRRNPLIDPAEIIGTTKQRKIITVAKLFLCQHTNIEATYRFDVALIEEHNGTINLRYIIDAFSAFD